MPECTAIAMAPAPEAIWASMMATSCAKVPPPPPCSSGMDAHNSPSFPAACQMSGLGKPCSANSSSRGNASLTKKDFASSRTASTSSVAQGDPLITISLSAEAYCLTVINIAGPGRRRQEHREHQCPQPPRQPGPVGEAAGAGGVVDDGERGQDTDADLFRRLLRARGGEQGGPVRGVGALEAAGVGAGAGGGGGGFGVVG